MGKPKASRHQRGGAPKTPTPATPRSPTPNSNANETNKPETRTQDIQSLLSPSTTPPSSPSRDTPAQQLPTFEQKKTIFNPTISADDIVSKDIVAIAHIFATMKRTLLIMTNTFDRLEVQTETFTSLSLDIKEAEQLDRVRKALEDQIARQKCEIEALGLTLKTRIKETVREKIRTELYDMVKASIAEKVEEKVKNELALQIPQDLHQQLVEHRRQILEVKTNIHNSEARRYNASLLSSSTAQLRPLLRPLPTPEQSPTIIVTQDSTSNTPVSALPSLRAPAPTPIKRSTSKGFETVPPTPSALFPRDLKTLFKLSADQARTLLQQYGLASAAPSPITPKPKGLADAKKNGSPSDSLNANGETSDEACHVEDMNKFMAHIGVPFLMIPPPKIKEPQPPTLSPTTRRRMLAPLIISATPQIFY